LFKLIPIPSFGAINIVVSAKYLCNVLIQLNCSASNPAMVNEKTLGTIPAFEQVFKSV
jgi:hypothetical protein